MLTSHPEGHTVELLLYRYEIQHLRVTGFQNGAGRNNIHIISLSMLGPA